MNLEVLVATMNQDDLSLYQEMNLRCDAIFANQCGRNDVQRENIDGHKVMMVSTDTVGVGLNRNLALMYATADIILFADDDVVYREGYEQEVINAFERYPDADAILFGTANTRQGRIVDIKQGKNRKLKFYHALKYGACNIACKRKTIKKYNIHFSELFGGGCIYSCGEDSLFITDLYRNRCRVYESDFIILSTARDESTWFQGFNEKYFYDKGAWLKCAFPKIYWLMKWYFLFRFMKLSEISIIERNKQLNAGISGFNKLVSYREL